MLGHFPMAWKPHAVRPLLPWPFTDEDSNDSLDDMDLEDEEATDLAADEADASQSGQPSEDANRLLTTARKGNRRRPWSVRDVWSREHSRCVFVLHSVDCCFDQATHHFA